jgi:hypothetical protein
VHLENAAAAGICELFHWRDRNREVDFVVRRGRRTTAIEMKSGRVCTCEDVADCRSCRSAAVSNWSRPHSQKGDPGVAHVAEGEDPRIAKRPVESCSR